MVDQNSIDLDELIATFGQATSFWQTQPQRKLLARARFADACRDASVQPIEKTTFENEWRQFDDEHQQRFGVLTAGFEIPAAARQLPQHSEGEQAPSAFKLLVMLTNELHLLTIDVLQQSDVRLEEFSRHFCFQWKLPIEGETSTESSERLHAIDFGRLMKEAESAKASAEDRLAYLRELQKKEEETRRPRRGKW